MAGRARELKLGKQGFQERELDLSDAGDEPFLGMALAGQVDYLVAGNLSDYRAECRRECAVVSPAQFMETWRKGNQ